MIKITCKSHTQVAIQDLKWFQDNLAETTKDRLDKLKYSIKKHGIFMAFSVWDDAGKLNIVDGHARKKALDELEYDGLVPVNFVLANSYEDAKEKVLLARSQTNATTEEGLFEFARDLDWQELTQELDLPGIDVEQFIAENIAGTDGYGDTFSLPDGDREPYQQMTFTLHDQQAEIVKSALKKVNGQGQSDLNENSNGNSLTFICENFLESS